MFGWPPPKGVPGHGWRFAELEDSDRGHESFGVCQLMRPPAGLGGDGRTEMGVEFGCLGASCSRAMNRRMGEAETAVPP